MEIFTFPTQKVLIYLLHHMKGHEACLLLEKRASTLDSLVFKLLTFKVVATKAYFWQHDFLKKNMSYIITDISLERFTIITHIYPASFSIKTRLRNRKNSTKPSTDTKKTLKLMAPAVFMPCSDCYNICILPELVKLRFSEITP